jgi:uncharacterized membrane protein YjgN (DUF898 family)
MSVTDASAVSGPPGGPVRFIGQDQEFWRIVLRGGVLLMFTLGIYRFWLATDVRRFLWANTEIDGRSLEYDGSAVELLRGFLVAIALILPIYTVFFITVLDFGAYGTLMTLGAVLVLIFLSQYGIYLARRYRLTRTVFRGLRFHQTGSALHYSICAVWRWGLTVLTLGFAYPFTRAALERFKMRNTWFGDLRGRFEGKGSYLFVRGCLMWLAVLVPSLITLFSVLSINWTRVTAATRGGGDVMARIERVSPGFADTIVFALMMAAVCAILIAALLPAFHALVVRWWISGLRFGEIAAVSRLRTRDVYVAYLRFIGWMLLFALMIAVGIFFALLFIGFLFDGGQSQASEIVIVVMMVGFYVVSALGAMTLYQQVVMLTVWRLTADTTELVGDKTALGRVHASTEGASTPLGEGIADVLNIGGI